MTELKDDDVDVVGKKASIKTQISVSLSMKKVDKARIVDWWIGHSTLISLLF